MIYWRYMRLNHEQPICVQPDSCDFITACGKPRGLNQFCHPSIGQSVLDSIGHYHEKGRWFCDLAVLMPDHTHRLLHFPPDQTMTKTVGLWKRWIARVYSIQWQSGFFDHRLRNEENIDQKGLYILQNPIRAKLVERPED